MENRMNDEEYAIYTTAVIQLARTIPVMGQIADMFSLVNTEFCREMMKTIDGFHQVVNDLSKEEVAREMAERGFDTGF